MSPRPHVGRAQRPIGRAGRRAVLALAAAVTLSLLMTPGSGAGTTAVPLSASALIALDNSPSAARYAIGVRAPFDGVGQPAMTASRGNYASAGAGLVVNVHPTATTVLGFGQALFWLANAPATGPPMATASMRAFADLGGWIGPVGVIAVVLLLGAALCVQAEGCGSSWLRRDLGPTGQIWPGAHQQTGSGGRRRATTNRHAVVLARGWA